MQVKELESKGLKRKFQITVEANQIATQTEAELKAAGERVRIPGFRPGNIPMKVLRQRYGQAVQADVLNKVINRSTTDAIVERKLRPALSPQVNVEKYEEGGALTFSMEFEIFPEVPEIPFKDIVLKRSVVDISEKDIDDALARIAERSPSFNPAPEGSKAKNGNVLTIDFKGMIGGVAFEGGAADNYNLELGSKQFIEGFEEQLVGCKKGDDKIVKVTFPKDYQSEKLAGKEASFSVKVKEILIKETPAVDEEFAKSRGMADLRTLREAVRNQLIKEYDQVVRNQLKKQLFDDLEEIKLEVPQAMVKMEFDSIWERLMEAKKQGDDSFTDKTDEDLKAEYQRIAERRVKLGIMLAEIGNNNKIQVAREELNRAAMQQASMFPGQERKVMEFYRDNPDRIEELRGPILEEKVVDYILTKIEFEDRKVTPEELIKLSEDEGVTAKKSDKPKAKKKK